MSKSVNLGKVLITNEGDWDSTREYEQLCIVVSEHRSYMSKKKVPAGTPLSDSEYWGDVLDTSAAVDAINQVTEYASAASDAKNDAETASKDAKNYASSANQSLEQITSIASVVDGYKTSAANSASNADDYATAAENAATEASNAANGIKNMNVSATTLDADKDATATYVSAINSLTFGIPRGKSVTVDSELDAESTNPVENKVVSEELSSTLEEAKSYSDEKDTEVLENANAYSNRGDSDTLETAKAYSDNTISSAFNAAKSYSDEKLSSETTARTEADEALNKAISDAITALQQAIALKQDELTDEQKQQIADLHEDAVQDVTVNGSTIVTDGVAGLSTAGSGKLGLVQSGTNRGITVSSTGVLSTTAASTSGITDRDLKEDAGYGSIDTTNYDYAVKAALTDGVGASYTEAEQIAGCERLGIMHPKKEWKLVGSITGDEDDRGNIDTGCAVDLTGCTEIVIHAKCISSQTVNLGGNNAFYLTGSLGGSTTSSFGHILYAYTDGMFGFVPIITRGGTYNSNFLGSLQQGFCCTNGIFIRDITSIMFTSPSVVTSCDIQIYGR